MIVFGERVGGRWWFGASAMAAGCILVGMREEKGKDDGGSVELRSDEEEREILLAAFDEDRR